VAIGLDPLKYATHSMRYQSYADLPAHGQPARRPAPFGHTKIESTVRDLGVEVDDALEIAEKIDVWTSWAELPCSALPPTVQV
jgi:hypothetical protein